jgi:cellulose 1,4-beta-cellobiosidase
MNVAKCANAQNAYLECINYALIQLNLPNVAMYLDAGMLSFRPNTSYIILS